MQGVSTHRVTSVLEILYGIEVASTQASRSMVELDPILEAWKNRPIPPITHLILEARYKKIRVDIVGRSYAVFAAIGIRNSDEQRTMLGTTVSLSEAGAQWRTFFSSLTRIFHGRGSCEA